MSGHSKKSADFSTEQEKVNQAEWERDENWHGPLGFYFSRLDSRTVVPKPAPDMGLTTNFAHMHGWWWVVALLIVLVGWVVANWLSN